MNKLPHEKLREWAKKAEDGEVAYPSDAMDHDMEGRSNLENEIKAFNKLADEIERVYIAWPRYEDGEPVQFGDKMPTPDKYGTKEISRICFTPTGYYFNSSKSSNGKSKNGQNGRFRYGESVKRPDPKVYDADGVEIKRDDAVWDLTGIYDVPLTVLDVDDIGVKVATPDGKGYTAFKSRCLTHREPDSLKRLRDDIRTYNRYLRSPRDWAEVAARWANRLTALIERGA